MYKNLIKKKYKLLNGFSVAEAFIVLGLGAIITSTIAHIITKQVKHNNYNETQSTIMQQRIEEINNYGTEIKEIVDNRIKKEINDLIEKGAEVPIGAVMFFDLTNCPDGWEKLSIKYPKAINAFLSNQTGSNHSVGFIEESAAPNIKGSFHAMDLRGIYSGPFYQDGGSTVYGYGKRGQYYYRQQGMDLSLVSTLYQNHVNEVRPQNIALLACRKTEE